MRNAYDIVQYPYRLGENLTDVLPLVADHGKVTLGPLEVQRPEWVYRRYEGRKCIQVLLPQILHRVLPREVDLSYWGAENRRALTAVLGPSFPKRWNLANYLAFCLPVRRLLGTTVYNADVKGPRGRGTYDDRLSWYLTHHEACLPVVRDGYARFLPLVRELCAGIDFAVRDMAEAATLQQTLLAQPLGILREAYGKGLWKRLCAQSPSRLIRMAQMIRHVGYYYGHNPLERSEQLLAELLEIPTTLLHGPWLRERVQGEEATSVAATTLRHLRELTRQRIGRFGADQGRYERALHNWDFVFQRNTKADPRWTVRRVQQEHDRLLREYHQENLRRQLENEKDLLEPVTVPAGAAYSHSDLATRLTARLLATPAEYLEQGTHQHHCVGLYGKDARRGHVVTYSIEQDGAIVSTAMFSAHGSLMQHYAAWNADVTDPTVNAFVDRLRF